MNLIKSHKIVTATILVGIIGSAVGITVINQPVDSPSIEVSSVVKEKPAVESAKIPAEQSQEIEETPVVTEVVETVEVAPVVEVEPAPAVLSTREYASIYLDVSDPVSLMCIDAMETRYPDRFTPEVRERNIKALRAFSDPCAGSSTELLFNKRASHYLDYPYHGAFWDSELANKHNN